MAVKRSGNFLNQQRIDVPHIRSIESGIRNDFDELISSVITGENKSYVIRGWEINTVGAIGSSASSLQMIVENSALLHGKSIQSGTFLQVATGVPNQTINSTTNTAVQGSFTPSSLNYIGIEFSRAVDNSTAAQVFLWNPTNKTEISKTVPLAETLDYKIVISSSVWASNVVPIAIVETDSANNVLSIEESRDMLYRLGTGGSTPNPFNTYAWDHQAEGRAENPSKTTSATSPFRGGDKQIQSEKEFYDAVMSMILEIKGTTYWYSPNSGGSIIKLRGDLALLQMTGSGKFIHAKNTAGQINWDSDVYLNYIGSRLSYKILANTTGTNCLLADDQVAYINLVRGAAIIPNLIFTQSSAIVSSVGSVSWTSNIQAGDYIKIGAEDDTKYYKVASVDTASQVTLSSLFLESSTGSVGAISQYAYGTYQTAAVPTTNRHVYVVPRKDVPFNEDTYWLFMRADNGSSVAKVYIRGSSGGELQQGEDREISDNTTLEVLEYMGAKSEVDNAPDYTNALATGVAEQRTLTFGTITVTGQKFYINSALDIKKYYVWANVNGSGSDPLIPGREGVEVNVLSTDSGTQVATKFAAVLSTISYFTVTDHLNGSISVDNSQVGSSTDAVNIDVSNLTITTTVQGAGSYNSVVVDAENLTRAIKRLDESVGVIEASLDNTPYQQSYVVPSTIIAGTAIKLPVNSRNSNLQESYIVDKADLEVFLNGVAQAVNRDYSEVGTSGDASIYIYFAFDLYNTDVIEFRKITAQGAGGGSGSVSGVNVGSAADGDVFKQTIGSQLEFRRLKAGTNITMVQNANDITISSSAGTAPLSTRLVNGVNSSIISSDSIVHCLNSGVNVTFTLPDATTVDGQTFYFKKRDAGNTLYIKTVFGQLLDGVDVEAAPYAIAIQMESITVQAMSGSYWIQ